MKISGMVVGVAMAALLLALLALTRLLTPPSKVPDIELREIEITSLPEPPPPPPEDEPPPDAPPPPPALTEVAEVPDPSMVPIPKADVPMDVTMPVDPFFTDIAPSPLPQPVVEAKPRPRPVERLSRPAPPAKPRPVPKPAMKSSYAVSELDGKPRLLRHGRASFPPALSRRGVNQGTVTLRVELSTSGGVTVLGVISSTHAELVAAAKRVASGSRFTAPTKNGQRVKAVMSWPIVIRK
ncbi:protein TonB [Haloferula luteola]|uniref:Protein TonB n=1 Tax=Haloferula luteola TaxID=595692 RepID=A0A840V485_9BACT|nr:TonB family protein [Haloferula luteola]MBB5352825.1 protein TonB [Haloferula luteola]